MRLLCIWAPPVERYRRLANRKIRPLSEAEAMSRDIAEIENLHKGGPIALADYLIVNDADEKSLLDKLEDFYKHTL